MRSSSSSSLLLRTFSCSCGTRLPFATTVGAGWRRIDRRSVESMRREKTCNKKHARVETSVTSIRPRRCTGLGLRIPCIHRMAHSDTSALNASGVKGIDVGATATAAGCSGKTQLHGDLSFVLLRPADQKLWVFEDFEALKLLFRGRSRPFKVDFLNLRGRFYKDSLSSTHFRLSNMKRRAPACGMSSADHPPAEPRCTGCGCCATVACLSSLGMDVYLRT